MCGDEVSSFVCFNIEFWSIFRCMLDGCNGVIVWVNSF